MKSVTDKYLEMNHSFIELRDSIFQQVEEEKPIQQEIYNKLIFSLGILNDFLTLYKKENNVNTKVKEVVKELTANDLEIIEV
jgi:hypothetical protein